jgi:cellulose synthase/poly-beta-1,6-N-acetylglucosamine synthase-like glycosyltransferase
MPHTNKSLPVIHSRGHAAYLRFGLRKRAILYQKRSVSPSRNDLNRARQKTGQDRRYIKKLALLLPAYNEELIIAATIKSALAAGQLKRDIFVVDDASSDSTRKIAVEMLGKDHVLTVQHSGKALAVQKAIKKFKIKQNYTWLHIADADSVFSPNYFKIYRQKLDPKKYAVALGFVQSMRGNWISTYRAISYTYSQHVNRRVQNYLRMISVFPGPITCFRTDILDKLDFDTNSLTEDFDITLQVHRKKLGRILFIPKAVNYTQDPQTLSDFIKQNLRWQRGLFQGLKKYRIGRQLHLIDLSIGSQLFMVLLFLVQIFVLVPMVIIMTGNWTIIPTILAADFILNSVIALFSSVVTKRWYLLGAMPYFYFLRWLEVGIFFRAFFEVIVLKRFQTEVRGWETTGRRYSLSKDAMRDLAQ